MAKARRGGNYGKELRTEKHGDCFFYPSITAFTWCVNKDSPKETDAYAIHVVLRERRWMQATEVRQAAVGERTHIYMRESTFD